MTLTYEQETLLELIAYFSILLSPLAVAGVTTLIRNSRKNRIARLLKDGGKMKVTEIPYSPYDEITVTEYNISNARKSSTTKEWWLYGERLFKSGSACGDFSFEHALPRDGKVSVHSEFGDYEFTFKKWSCVRQKRKEY